VDGDRATDEAEDSSAPSAENAAGSALQKRRKKASERTTGLANVTLPEKSSGLPSPEATGPDDEIEQVNGVDADDKGNDEDDGDDDLEAMLWAEMNSPDDDEIQAEPELATA
jgi:RNA polymerase II subunit A-like phosphatase